MNQIDQSDGHAPVRIDHVWALTRVARDRARTAAADLSADAAALMNVAAFSLDLLLDDLTVHRTPGVSTELQKLIDDFAREDVELSHLLAQLSRVSNDVVETTTHAQDAEAALAALELASDLQGLLAATGDTQ
jgi:hypothetical protein